MENSGKTFSWLLRNSKAESEKTLMLSANSKKAPPCVQTVLNIYKRVEKNHQSRWFDR